MTPMLFLAALALLSPAASAPRAIALVDCAKVFSLSQPGADCGCEGEPGCVISITVTPLANPFTCGFCEWDYSYSVTCSGECATPVGSSGTGKSIAILTSVQRWSSPSSAR